MGEVTCSSRISSACAWRIVISQARGHVTMLHPLAVCCSFERALVVLAKHRARKPSVGEYCHLVLDVSANWNLLFEFYLRALRETRIFRLCDPLHYPNFRSRKTSFAVRWSDSIPGRQVSAFWPERNRRSLYHARQKLPIDSVGYPCWRF